MTAYEFMSSNGVLTIFIIYMLTATLFRCVNRFFRCMNIRKHGWPPAHCDADGDFKLDEEQ